MDPVVQLELQRTEKAPLRAPMTPDQLADLRSRLHLTRMEFRSMGREMDIADIVDVVQKFDLHHSAT